MKSFSPDWYSLRSALPSSTHRKVTRVSCTLAASQYVGFFSTTTLLLTCQSLSTYAPLLTMLPGFVQSLPNFSITALGCGAYCATDITAGQKGTGPAVRTSSVCLSIAF